MSRFLPSLSLPALTDLQSDLSRRQPDVVLPQLTPPHAAIFHTHILDEEPGVVRVGQQARRIGGQPLQPQVRGQRTPGAAGQVELLARTQTCGRRGSDCGVGRERRGQREEAQRREK